MKLKVIEDYRRGGKSIGSVGDELEVKPSIFVEGTAATHIRRALTELAGILLRLNSQVEASNPDNPEKWADEVIITIKLK